VEQVYLTHTNFNGVAGPLVCDVTYTTNKTTQLANPASTLWTNAAVALVSGTNFLVAHELDEAGKIGDSARRVVFLLEQTSLILSTNGPGRVLGTSAGVLGVPTFTQNGATNTNVFVNIGYKITAQPLLHKQFLGWFDGNDNPYPGPSPANTNKVLFYTIPNTNGLSLQAKFQ
jgi:hypothetical protein